MQHINHFKINRMSITWSRKISTHTLYYICMCIFFIWISQNQYFSEILRGIKPVYLNFYFKFITYRFFFVFLVTICGFYLIFFYLTFLWQNSKCIHKIIFSRFYQATECYRHINSFFTFTLRYLHYSFFGNKLFVFIVHYLSWTTMMQS